MKFTIKQSALNKALAAVGGALERKGTIPVLSNVLIESIGEGAVNVTATDLDITIRRTAEADIEQPGAVCIDARKLTDIVRNLPDIELRFESEPNHWVQMRAGKSKTRFAGVSRDQFAETPVNKSTPVKMSAATFAKLVAGTAFATTNDPSRFTMSGCKLEVEKGVARMIALDGHRLALREFEIGDKTAELSVLIPKKALTEAAKITEGDIRIGCDPKHFFVETDDQILAARLLTGQFPNYEMVMPKDNDQTAECLAGDLRAAVQRALVLGDDRNRSVRLAFADGEIRVKACSSDAGEADEFVEADFSGEGLLGFNWSYLLDLFKVAADSDRVQIDFKADSVVPTEFRIIGDESFRYLIVQLRF